MTRNVTFSRLSSRFSRFASGRRFAATTLITALFAGGGQVAEAQSWRAYLDQAPPKPPVEFVVWRNGSKIGEHRVEFRQVGDRLHATTESRIEVDVLFLNVFDYQHRSEEVWEGDTLISLTSDSNDNGDRYQLEVSRLDDGYRVVMNGMEKKVEGNVMPSSYWRMAVLQRDQLLSTQKGMLFPISARPTDERVIPTSLGPTAAECYMIEAKVDTEVCYAADDGRWLSMEVEAKGSKIHFLPPAAGPPGERVAQR